jgi:hypothetical protein
MGKFSHQLGSLFPATGCKNEKIPATRLVGNQLARKLMLNSLNIKLYMKKNYLNCFFQYPFQHTVLIVCITLIFSACKDTEGVDEETVTPKPVSLSPKAEIYDTSVAIEWNKLLLDLLEGDQSIASPMAARAIGYQNLALYESIVNGTNRETLSGKLYRFGGVPNAVDSLEYNWGLAANVAQYTIIQSFFPKAGTEQNAKIDALLSKYEKAFRGNASQAIIKRSIEYGAAVATAVFNYARQDGLNGTDSLLFNNSYVFPDGLGVWKANPPQTRPLLTQWKLLRPMHFPNKYLSPIFTIPFSYRKESAFFAEAMQVYEASKNLTSLQKQKSAYWEGDGLGNNTVRNIFGVLSEAIAGKSTKLDEAALLYLKGAIVMSDGVISVWRNKYEFNQVRPDTYVKETLDENWKPTLGVSYSPSFPSLSATLAGAVGELIRTELGGSIKTPFSTSPITVSDFKSEVIRAAINGGTNFNNSGQQGYELGERIFNSTNSIDF